jgi:hypothetical protein
MASRFTTTELSESQDGLYLIGTAGSTSHSICYIVFLAFSGLVYSQVIPQIEIPSSTFQVSSHKSKHTSRPLRPYRSCHTSQQIRLLKQHVREQKKKAFECRTERNTPDASTQVNAMRKKPVPMNTPKYALSIKSLRRMNQSSMSRMTRKRRAERA